MIFLAGLLAAGCVGSKKYKETVASYTAAVDTLQTELSNAQGMINTLKFELARTNGANEALVLTQDKLQTRIDDLQAEIERLKNTIALQQRELGGRLTDKDAEIANVQAKVDGVRRLLNTHEERLRRIADSLRTSLNQLSANQYAVEVRNGRLVLSLNESVLFRSGATSRLEAGGTRVLRDVAFVLQGYPEMMVEIVGHTDNQAVDRRSVDNWDFSVLRATTVVRYLTQDLNLGPNRVLAAGKGAFAPRVSNETSAGRAENRRVDLIIQPADTDLVRDVRRVIGE